MVGGLYPLGKTAKELSQGRLKEAKVGIGTIAARLRALAELKLVVQVRQLHDSSTTAYQRTKLADKELAGWNPPTA